MQTTTTVITAEDGRTRLCVNHHAMVWFQVLKDEEVFFRGNSDLYGHLELSRPRHRVSSTIPRLPLFAGRYELRVFLVDDAHFFPTGKTPKEKVGVLVDQAWRIE